jgi:outer membrane murein-binding lipoprotein Lpp
VKPTAVTAYFLSLVCVALFATSLMSACTKSQRVDTLRSTVVSVNAARDGFIAWDREHQQSIVDHAASREDGAAALATYRTKREPIMITFEVAYRALAVAATQTDDLSLKSALSVSGDLIDAIKALMKGL